MSEQHCTVNPSISCDGSCITTGVFVNEDKVSALEAAGLPVTREAPPASMAAMGKRLPMVHLCPELQDNDELLDLVAQATEVSREDIVRAISTSADVLEFMAYRAATDALAGQVFQRRAGGDPQ